MKELLLHQLVQYGKLKAEDARRAEMWDVADESALKERLQRSGLVSEGAFAEVRARALGLAVYTSLPSVKELPKASMHLPSHFIRSRRLIPIEEENGSLIAVTDQVDNFSRIEELGFILGKNLRIAFAERALIDDLISSLYKSDQPKTPKKKAASPPKASPIFEDSEELSPVNALLQSYLIRAIDEGASDIHFEPTEEGLNVRFRIDGALVFRPFEEHEMQGQLLTRIKVMAGLDIAEHRLAQDGRIQFTAGGRAVDLRVSVIPVANGQRIVLRILDKSKMLLDVEALGMPRDLLKQFKRQIVKPEGLVLVTGPTGSGKTTSLYSAVSEINVESVNIMTIEDPIEYRMHGVSQMAVRPEIGLTFAEGLRHLLRQDPDIMMVGEIRDSETAKIAVQSALTGHLVLSTLHTNDAPSAIVRLIEMGIESYLLSSSLVGVLAQRLVRTICPECKESYVPTKEELMDLGIESAHLWRGMGCKSCFGTGYSGRRAIFELLDITPDFRALLGERQSAKSLYQHAEASGMKSLRSSGASLVREGVTTSTEVMRVTS